MSTDQDQNYDNDNFDDMDLEDPYELDFSDSKALKKRHKAKARRDARHRLEDYFDRKALKEQVDDWDYNLDY